MVVLPGTSLEELKGNSLGELMYRGVVKLCETLLKS